MVMAYSHLSVHGISLCFLLHLCVAANFPAPYSPVDKLAMSCGSTGNSIAPDGRQWTGDIGSEVAHFQKLTGKSVTLKPVNEGHFDESSLIIPYTTARISRSRFTYKFKVNPGQKFIRLHFYPASYPGFERSNAFFTVKAGPYTLLSNFSASLTTDAMGLNYLVKEFCLNVENNKDLPITFFPNPDVAAYAFINGIEIVSMPTGLYYSQTHPSARVVGLNYLFYIENNTALEMVQRLNVGGSSISSVQDTGMFREWYQDTNYFVKSDLLPIVTTIPIKYASTLAHTAPQKVYQTTWSMGPVKEFDKNLTWKLSVDLGFRYLVRLHFCELEYGVRENGQRRFSIFINKQIAEACADVTEWSGGNGVAVYRDYVVMIDGDRVEGKRDLVITLRPHCDDRETENSTHPILNGLELFKLSNPDNNLAGPNPVPLAVAKTPKAQKLRKACLHYHSGNAFVNVAIIAIIVLNIFVHQLRIWAEDSHKENITMPSPKENCRHFSLAEMQSATDNFADAFTIGFGGFGKVYKGLIDDGATTVAIKRLNFNSKQGAREFWTEIEMLSDLRHPNLVTLIGYCDECQEMILVYEFMELGTLADLLHKNRGKCDAAYCLNWEQRLNICIGAARGLNSLHMGDPGIIHRDVKSTNILLDMNWVAKISDFGLSKMGITSQSRSYISTDVKGTFGYLDPEYYVTRRLTRKSDVYAFGVVLLEVLCGRPALDFRLEEDQHSLMLWAQHSIENGMLDQIVDPRVRATQISHRSLELFSELANNCLHKYPKRRPTMNDVVEILEHALSLQKSLGSCFEEEAIRASVAGNEQTDGIIQLADLQHVESPLFREKHTPLARKRNNTSTIIKVVKNMTLISSKGKESERKKARDYSSGNVSSLWFWRKAIRHKSSSMETIPEVSEFESGNFERFSLSELQAATNNFSSKNVVGRGGFGKVYKGRLFDGSMVAIKRLKQEHSQSTQVEFNTEMHTLSMVVHRNLIPLRGICMTRKERILVYPFMANGSLASLLRERPESQIPLDWRLRQRIALEVARGLEHLHDHCDPKIIHRDVKAANVWLNERFEAVVGGFGFAELMSHEDTHVSTAVRGTIGHIAPEYLATGKASEKTDVFGYGAMLLELISGQRAFDLARLAHDEDVMLLDWAKGLLKEKKLETLVDANLQGNYVKEEVENLVQVALLCSRSSAIERPKMSEVVRFLEGNGLAERWEELRDEADLGMAAEEMLHDTPVIEDSTCRLHPEELSGPR